VQYGPLALDVPPGDWRNLTLLEVAKLKTAASGPKLTLPPPPAPALHAGAARSPGTVSKPIPRHDSAILRQKKKKSRGARGHDDQKRAATPRKKGSTYASLIAERGERSKTWAHEVPGGLPGSKR
jgi:hypothetical protein